MLDLLHHFVLYIMLATRNGQCHDKALSKHGMEFSLLGKDQDQGKQGTRIINPFTPGGVFVDAFFKLMKFIFNVIRLFHIEQVTGTKFHKINLFQKYTFNLHH